MSDKKVCVVCGHPWTRHDERGCYAYQCGCEAPRASAGPETPPLEDAPLLHAAVIADWQQVVLNGGPPCFHLEGNRFCLRAERWMGHGAKDPGHAYVSLADLLARLKAETPPQPNCCTHSDGTTPVCGRFYLGPNMTSCATCGHHEQCHASAEALVARLAELEAKATPGPWESVTVLPAGSADGKTWSDSPWRLLNGPPQVIQDAMQSRRAFTNQADTEFIAALRNAWPEIQQRLRQSAPVERGELSVEEHRKDAYRNGLEHGRMLERDARHQQATAALAAPDAPREEPFTPEQVEGMAKVMLDTPWYEPAKMLEAYARLLRQPPADRPSVNCPLCGVSVEQVASATLSLALWQHVQWVCKSQNSAFSGVAQEWKA